LFASRFTTRAQSNKSSGKLASTIDKKCHPTSAENCYLTIFLLFPKSIGSNRVNSQKPVFIGLPGHILFAESFGTEFVYERSA
jgi:hypothetical protein